MSIKPENLVNIRTVVSEITWWGGLKIPKFNHSVIKGGESKTAKIIKR